MGRDRSPDYLVRMEVKWKPNWIPYNLTKNKLNSSCTYKSVLNLAAHSSKDKIVVGILRLVKKLEIVSTTIRATPVRRANGLSYKDLVAGDQKSIFSRESKWATILVSLPNFSPHPPIWWPSIWAANCGSPIYTACWSGGPYLGE